MKLNIETLNVFEWGDNLDKTVQITLLYISKDGVPAEGNDPTEEAS